jgi:hypothetical protein
MSSKSILVEGESGAGKSSSLRNLNHEETFVISALGKGVPAKKSKSKYTVWNKNNPKGNFLVSSSSKNIIQVLKHININMLNIKIVIIDDATFLSAKELDRRRDEVGYNKFSDIAHDFLELSEVANTLRDDLNIYFMYHVDTVGDGVLEPKSVKAMSHGKMIQEKLASVEAQFEIVFLACKIHNNTTGNIEYKFKTRDSHSTAKTPIDMFSEEYIDNDLAQIDPIIREYYQE